MQAIDRLRRRFIALAMVSVAILLTLIVTGMNIMNYNKVVKDADARLEVLTQNAEMIQGGQVPEFGPGPDDEFLFGRGGPGGPRMSMDEAEESRFFTVEVDGDGSVKQLNIDRISAVNDSEAERYAERALAYGGRNGFVNDFRYSVSEDGSDTRITFLDCGRVLGSFRSFLRASIIMSLAGLAIVFAAICYFARRIVRPVAESYEKQKRFITDAGHEIKTPLAIIKANLDLMDMDLDEIQDKTKGAEMRENLEDIDAQVDRLAGLTDDLVYLSRMEEAGKAMVMSDTPLSDIAAETADSFRALAEENGKKIDAKIAPGITVQGSSGELEKLVSILLENAVKYSKDEDTIRISLKSEARNAVLEVANRTEDPVTNEELSHVFERFYRSDESRNSATGGHGIGLSMASAIVSAHKGRIAARTTDGQDFIVSVVLPG